MKIVHISISSPFIDSWGYQDNILPRYLQKTGAENFIVVSANYFPSNLKIEEYEAIKAKGNNYFLVDGVVVRRIKTKKISTSSAFTCGLKKVLNEIKPDVIFHHNINCTSMPISSRYAKRHGIPMVCDNHIDPINLTKNKLWLWLYYKFLTRLSCRLHSKQIYKAYGVTHLRCDFIHDYFGLPYDKIDFLPIGADVDLAETIDSKEELREHYGLSDKDFVVVSGGKMGLGKRTNNLITAVKELQSIIPQIKLVLFGGFEDDQTSCMVDKSGFVSFYGWCDRKKTLELLKMADVACWPYHHTTLIEDAVSVCTPLICRNTGTTEHLIENNGVWIESGTSAEINKAIRQLYIMIKHAHSQLEDSCNKMRDILSYNTVAEKVLEDVKQFEKESNSNKYV